MFLNAFLSACRCAPVPQPINRSVTVSGGEHAVISNGTAEVKRLPSVEFQLLNEVLNEDRKFCFYLSEIFSNLSSLMYGLFV